MSALRALLRRAYGALPAVLLAILRPFRPPPQDRSALLDRLAVPYEEGVYRMGRAHWERHARDLGLVGFQRVLDLGCGSGQWLPVLAALNAQVIGVEPHPRLLEMARRHTADEGKVRLVRASAEALCLRAQSVDAVLCYGVLMYTDYARVLPEIRRALRPGGRLVLGLPGLGYYLHHVVEGARFGDEAALRYGLGPIVTHWGQMLLGRRSAAVTYWTRGRVSRLLRSHGFAVQRVAPSRIDPTFPETYAGAMYFLGAEATRRAEG